jgi:hypothetical protein
MDLFSNAVSAFVSESNLIMLTSVWKNPLFGGSGAKLFNTFEWFTNPTGARLMLIMEDAMLATIMTPINSGMEITVIMNRLRKTWRVYSCLNINQILFICSPERSFLVDNLNKYLIQCGDCNFELFNVNILFNQVAKELLRFGIWG